MAMKRVTRRTTKRGIENDPFTSIPLDLKVEILMKLPPRSIARLRLASKHLSSIITGKEFTDLFRARSSTQPRYLISIYGPGYKKNPSTQLFHSRSQEDPLDSDLHDRVSSNLARGLSHVFTPPINGFICGDAGKIMIGNPNTGQFKSLPKLIGRNITFSCFGYDPVNDLYKVLCMTGNKSKEYHVITVGAKQKWRMVEYKYPHSPYRRRETQGICRDGVVYYLASYKEKQTLMSFNLSSEEFNVTKLPKDHELQNYGILVNHTGKITISSRMAYCKPIDLWFLKDAKKGVWSKAAAVAPSIADICGRDQGFVLRGILRTGEIIFQSHGFSSHNTCIIVCYDPKEKKFKKCVLEGVGDGDDPIFVFFDHVESYMFL